MRSKCSTGWSTATDIANIYNASTAGKCLAPEIVIEEPVNTVLTDNFGSIGFGSSIVKVPAGGAKTFTIRNVGTTTLNIASVDSSLADFAVGPVSDTTIEPNGIATFSVTFTPQAGGVCLADLDINSDDANESPFDIAMTGTGLVPGTLSFTATPYADSETNADHTFLVTVEANGRCRRNGRRHMGHEPRDGNRWDRLYRSHQYAELGKHRWRE